MRIAVIVAAISLLGAAGVAPAAAAPGPVPTVTAASASATRSVVAVTGASGQVSVTLLDGTVVGRASAIGGSAVVPVAAGPNWRVIAVANGRRVQIRIGPLAGSPTRLVNKRTPAGNYVPPLVRVERNYWLVPQAASGYAALKKASANAGYPLQISESYRSYNTQRSQHDEITRRLGAVRSDQLSARPGYSEHQLGLAVDIMRTDNFCTQRACFASTGLGSWIAANAWRYGFVVRYPQGQDAVTGYTFEPWHLRYLAVGVTGAMNSRGVSTYERWLGAANAPTY